MLVTTGRGTGGTKSEVIDLLNPKSTCKNWADYPIDLYAAAGQIVDNYPIICGGRGGGRGGGNIFIDNCYKITPKSAVSLQSLASAKSHSSAGVFNNALFVVGGYKFSGGPYYYSNTEYISKTNHQNGPNAPVKAFSQCVIQINQNEILLTGGGNFTV